LWAQAPARGQRIDVHHHILPPEYIAAIASRRGVPVPDWSPARSLEEIDRAGIATAMLSLVQPGVWFGDVAEGRRLSRMANDYGARLVRDHPGRFGLFATIPLPDTEGSLKEIEYAFDTLKADGISLMTSYGERWLGDAAFGPVWQELERRKAVIYTHPTQVACCRNLIPEVPTSTIEYATDTSRTMASILFTGTAVRYPGIRWIFSHGGGTVPFLLSRFTTLEANMKDKSKLPNGVVHELRRFYYDTAQANHAGALAALMKLVPVSQVVLGTDYPFRRAVEEIAGVINYGFSAADVRAIERDNALRLLRHA
jgi:predicted TIM-barrel fold metal-dependent hydrolase